MSTGAEREEQSGVERPERSRDGWGPGALLALALLVLGAIAWVVILVLAVRSFV